MESDLGKLFIGGISWNTDEDRLKEYFGSFGEVVEAVIMRDRATGRARGFGFIVFADPAVAERVVAEKHMIDGRTVEAKKAVPRDDQQMVNRNVSNLVQGSSPNLGRTKKIFVGGLASTVSESDFKAYFDQFGTITDVVVMYDHNTQRPRGFGFITFDSEEAVERVLHKTFHELNSKMVEVKRAVPKELSPGPARSPSPGYNYGFNRPASFLSNYGQGYNNLSSLAGYGGRFNPLGNRSALSPFGSLGYGIGMNLDPSLSLSIGGPTNFNNTNLGYGRVSSPYRYSNPIGYGGPTAIGNDSPLGASTWNPWGNSGINSVANVSSPPPYMSNGGGRFGVFGNRGSNWGSSPLSPQGNDGSASGYARGATGFDGGESNYRLSGRNNVSSSFAAPGGGFEGSYGDLYQSGSVYGDPGWRSASPEIDGSSSFDNALGDVAEVAAKGSEDYIGGYSIANRKTNRGIAA